jgi:SAM-dependent methyltransferase
MIVEPGWRELRDKTACEYGVSSAIHADDMIWQFIVSHSAFAQPADATNYYFADGAESARKLATLVHRHIGDKPFSLMEFASGYGMVTRHIGTVLPNANAISCDIHAGAVLFLRDELGMEAVGSTDVPEDLDLGRQFDVVFALSFFSHMPEPTFGSWLGALYRHVRPGGVLIFTTHGLASQAAFGHPEIPESGFWFKPESEQDDLEEAKYGSTISTPEFVIAALYQYTAAPLAEFRSGYWWHHQDLYVAARPTTDETHQPNAGGSRTIKEYVVGMIGRR